MIAAYTEQLKVALHDSALGQHPWLDRFLRSVIDLLTGPFTRKYRPEVVFAIVIAAIVYVVRDRRPSSIGPTR